MRANDHGPAMVDNKKILVAIEMRSRHLLLPLSGRSVAWLARLFRVQEVVSSNLTAPTILIFQGIQAPLVTPASLRAGHKLPASIDIVM